MMQISNNISNIDAEMKLCCLFNKLNINDLIKT